MSENNKKEITKQPNLFNGRMSLSHNKEEDKIVFDIVKKHMEENNIKTFIGAVKDIILKKNPNTEPIKHIHYWIPVSKEDIPKNMFENEQNISTKS